MRTIDVTRLSDLLVSQSLFADCSEDELKEIAERGTTARHAPGTEIMAQGEVGDAVYVVLSGIARVSLMAANGREIVLDYAEAGEVLGEIAMIDGGERTASVSAFTDCEMLRLSRAAFTEIVVRHPPMAMRLLQAMARRLRQGNATLEAERAYSSGPRLARFLLRLMVGEGGEGRLKLSLSQSELGNFAGMSREQINRQISAWVDGGIVARENGQVKILDRAMLMEVADEW